MAGLPQPDGSVLELFGSGGGDDTAARLDVPLLARVPLSVGLREGGDQGIPIVTNESDAAGAAIRELAAAVARRGRGLAGRPLGVTPR
jgi:ATP-binding protein involved in chromosome partitioning